ncbi:MAG: SH3 domain-containing protein [Christensenellales bacterium]|nr:SH3 domain-containing protein [Christensenellales bacterium]
MKKRFPVFLLLLVLLVSCLAPSALAETRNAWVKMAPGSTSLRLRLGPGKQYDTAGYVYPNQAISVFAGDIATDNEGEQWQRIQADGTYGYIKTKYVSYVSPSSPDAPVSTEVIHVPGGVLNVRKGPGTRFGIAGTVFNGETVQVLERGGTWSKIRVPRTGVTGYVMTKYFATSPAWDDPTGGSSSARLVSGNYRLAQITTKTQKGQVSLRKGPGTNYPILGNYVRGTLMNVLSSTGDWHQVTLPNGRSGYFHSGYVSFGIPGKTTARVNFRADADNGSAVLSTLPSGTKLTVNSVSGSWANVTVNGRIGYVHIRYVDI